MMTAQSLYSSPNALAKHYREFRVEERLLLTGHSHQAWPDRALEGQVRAWGDAALHVDEKWSAAFEQADRVRRGFAGLLGDASGDITLGANTHELLVRFLSALPLRERPRLVTTDGEFHTIRRQLDRLAEEGLNVVKVPAEPAGTLAARLSDEVDSRTAAVLVSSVLFQSARIVPGLGGLAAACARDGAELLVDAYHHLNVVPFATSAMGLESAFVVGGGYKYCQLGEGNCFLRVPPGCRMRPVVTGWFSEFGELDAPSAGGRVGYGSGADRFAGSTYDPTSHYRGAAVFDFFSEQRLHPELLREVSQHQIGVLAAAFDSLDADPALVSRDGAVPLTEIAGFLALRSPQADTLSAALRVRGVLTDFRGHVLRLGPAPYLSDEQLGAAVEALGECIAVLAATRTPTARRDSP